jgi:hypothetical protein
MFKSAISLYTEEWFERNASTNLKFLRSDMTVSTLHLQKIKKGSPKRRKNIYLHLTEPSVKLTR